MREHIVKAGEHLSTIAEIYGFRDYRSIWDDPANAALSLILPEHDAMHK